MGARGMGLAALLLSSGLLWGCGGGSGGDADAGGELERCGPDSCPDESTECVDVEGGGFECRCVPGTRPVDGECLPPDGCEPDTCSGHGECLEEDGAVSCACDVGWDGVACERCADGYHDDGAGGCTDDACVPDPCADDPDRECVVGDDGGPVCACAAGTHDEGGECVPDTTCMETTCSGAGTCEERDGRVFCTCDEGHAGTFCDACDEGAGWHDDGAGGCTTDPCTPNPCDAAHRTVCRVDDLGSAVCDCDAGYHEELGSCVVDEVCETDTCGDHGDCAVVGGRVECTCHEGYTGAGCTACDTAAGWHDDGAGGCTTDPCTPNPCTVANRSVCTADGSGGHSCACDAGYHDDGVGGCTTDPCVPDPCAASGMACRDAGGTAECYTPTCDDDNPCTEDSFTGGSCVFTPLADGSPCSTTLCITGQVCGSGVCGSGTAVSCDDDNPCTDDSCDALTGCSHVADDTNVPDDGVACTDDACSGGVESHTPSDAFCDDDSWCTGSESCAPGAAGADADGCVATDVPPPPGPSGPCGSWECDDATTSFTLSAAAAGTGCDDRIACTTGDACDGTGACRGTVTGDCAAGASCGAGSTAATVDIVPARVSGRVRFAGGALPSHSQSTTNIGLWLRSEDTGAQHLLEVVSFSGSWDGTGYPRASYSERDDLVIDLPVLPGVYDVVYRRYSTGDGDFVSNHDPDDPYAFGNQVLLEDVVLGPGHNELDVDIAPARVSGSVLFSGGALPTHSGSTTNVGLWLRSRATGSQQLLEVVSFGSWDGTGYPRASYSNRDDLALDIPVLPGVYDVVYRRYSTGDGDFVSNHDPDDPYAFGNQVLMRDVVIGPGTTSLDVDIAPGNVNGSVLFAGGALPSHSQSTTNIGVWLRSQDTGSQQLLEVVSFSGSWDGTGYPRASYSQRDDLALDIPVLPGVYDVVYRRYSTGDGDFVSNHDPDDPFAFGNQVVMRDVTIGSGTTALDVDVAPVTLSGTVEFGGGALPARSQSTTNIGIWLRSQDTGSQQLLEVVSFSGSWDGTGYPRASYSQRDDLTIDIPVVPGTYDVVYRRYSTGDGDFVSNHDPDDPYAFGNQVLERDVVLATGSTTLDVDIAPVTVTGSIVFDGSTLPPHSQSTTNIGVWLRSQDTGSQQLLEVVSFSGTWDGTGYPRASYSERDDLVLDIPVVPGTYDLVYRRYSTGDGDFVSNHDPDDPYAFGNQLLQRDVVLGTGSTALTVDVAPTQLGGDVVYGGGDLPTHSQSTTNIGIWLRSHDTGAQHLLEVVSFSGSWDGTGYPRASYSTRDDLLVDLPVVPGAYDVVYRRYSTGDGDYVSNHDPSDPYAFANQGIGMCVVIP